MIATEPGATDGLDLVRALPMMQLLPAELHELVVGSFQVRSYGFGEYIVVQGDPGDAFYVLVEGLVRVIRLEADGTEVTVDLMRPGESFGEVALLENAERTRSIRASEPAVAARLERGVFQSLVRLHPQLLEMFEIQRRTRRLQGFLRQHPAFSTLPPGAVAGLLRSAGEIEASAGQRIVREGDPAQAWWVVEDGRLTVFQEREVRRNIRFLRTGDIFGEMALIEHGSRTASIEATTDCRLLEFAADTFDRLLMHDRFKARIDERVAMYAQAARVPLDFPEHRTAPNPLRADKADASAARKRAADDARITDGVQLADASAEQLPWTPPRRFPLVRQIDEADCGPACVAMLCRAFGERVSLNFIRHSVGTGEQGTSLRGLQSGGAEIGLEVAALKSSVSHISNLSLPAILHWEGNHWVVLYKLDAERAWLADPGRGLRTVALSELEDNWSGFAATARPTARLADAPRERLEAGWLVQFLAPHRKRLLIALAMALLTAGTEMLPPILSQNVIDAVLGRRGAGRVNVLVGIMVVVLLVSLAASLVQRRVIARTAVELDGDTLDFITGRLLSLPLSYFQSRRTGDIERRLSGMRQLRQIVVQSAPTALAGAVQLAVTVVIMFSFSWVIGLTFLATAPLYALLMRLSSTRLRPTFDSLEESYARHASKQIDAIKGIEAVKTAGAEPAMRSKILREFERLADRVFNADFVLMSYGAAVQLVGFAIFVLFLWIAALLAIDGTITVGGVVAINSLVLLANAPIATMLGLWDQLQNAAVLLQRLQDVLDAELEQSTPDAELRSVPTLGGQLTLRRVGLSYRDAPDRPVLTDVSFTLEPGMSLGLVGRSGSGKSSLLRCLAGLLVPSTGAILYDDVDLRELRWTELRRRIGFVLQESYLFDDTIAANIALGDVTPDMEQVARAAEIAAAAEFIAELPLGYLTRIGEAGIKLSGGQAQRIAIARALYHDPPIVLFDEATSALDTESERAVKDNLDRVMANRTAVIVAHRLSTVRDADVIGVLDRGRLVEWGSHEQLMAREGLYFHLNMVQVSA
ncbi:MAG: peptidase domain-containing ABC transporter [Solirubrobacteraceae bacterium]